MKKLTVLAMCAFTLMLLGTANADVRYKVIDLGALGTPNLFSEALDINSRWEVVGSAYDGTAYHAFYWPYNNAMLDLGTLGGTNSQAFAISEHGAVVGSSYTADDSTVQAFFWMLDSGMTSLGTAGGEGSMATCVGLDGKGGGGSDITGNAAYHAFAYDMGLWTDLLTLGGTNSIAWDMNDAGAFAGDSDMPDGTQHAFLWNGSMSDLGTLGGDNSFASAIDENGNIVGSAETSTGNLHAFLHDSSMHDLDTFGGDSAASDINSAGIVVGQSQGRAVKWDQSGIVDLNTQIAPDSGWVLMKANAINSAGGIVGVGSVAIDPVGKMDHAMHAFVLVPIPAIGCRVILQDFNPAEVSSVPVTVEITRNGGGTTTLAVNLSADGIFVLPNLETGTYDLKFSAGHWLKSSITGIVVDNDLAETEVALVNGDANGDNSVGSLDLLRIKENWNSQGSSVDADLNGDGTVGSQDVEIAKNNWGAEGAQ